MFTTIVSGLTAIGGAITSVGGQILTFMNAEGHELCYLPILLGVFGAGFGYVRSLIHPNR